MTEHERINTMCQVNTTAVGSDGIAQDGALQSEDGAEASEREAAFLSRMAAVVSRKRDRVMIDKDDAARLLETALRYRRMDSEAAQYVEMTICLRSKRFTGEPPYVGWEGLGLALKQDYDDLEAFSNNLDRFIEEVRSTDEVETED